MNVLSLFDGMSCGQLALKKAGVKVKKYLASEIDPHAIKVTQSNFPNTFFLPNVLYVEGKELPKIDLLIGGSPCQGFSFAGKQLNFDDPRSKLFFEYVRLLKECKPKYFLLENVVMKKESMDVITEYLGVQPILINSALLSAQNRKRLYWSNIPGISQPDDKKIFIESILENKSDIPVIQNHGQIKHKPFKSQCLDANYFKGVDNHGQRTVLVHNIYGGFKENHCRVFEDKSPTLRANSGGGSLPSVFYGTKEEALALPLSELRKHIRKLSVLECKRLQTVPDDYKMNVSKTQAYKMLGNGWTVDVVAHIFKGLND